MSDAAPVVMCRGLLDYRACWHEMQKYTAERDATAPDQIWLVQHPSVYTLGQAAQLTHLFGVAELPIVDSIPEHWHGIPVVKIDRGGQVSYHGPGQIIAYLLLDLKRRHLFVRDLVHLIEEAVIEILAEFNIAGRRWSGYPGVYLSQGPYAQAKIAALGLKISRGCSYHGVALNVAMDLQPFNWINPCGQANLRTIDLLSLGVKQDLFDVEQRLSQHLLRQLEIQRSLSVHRK